MPRRNLLQRVAIEVLGVDKASGVWKRIDIIGDILLLKKGFNNKLTVEDYRRVAEKLLETLPYVKSIWLVTGSVVGPFKTRSGLIHLAGERRTTTIYKEHGCKFFVDISKVFITPRLSYEHKRIASLVHSGEVIVNMFSGAGLFSIIIACKSDPKIVYSIDINKYAINIIEKNIKLNNVKDKVIPLLGDAKEVIMEKLVGVADRVLMPFPELALDYLPYAIAALRHRGGIIHIYLHVDVPRGVRPEENSRKLVINRLREIGVLKYNIIGVRKVRSVGPRLMQTVVDVLIERDD